MPTPTVFISHSHLDNTWCQQFVAALQSLSYDAWYDEKGLNGGLQWVKTIEHEVETRDIFAIILTPDSWESEWVQEELQLALNMRRRILPIMLKATQISGFVLNRQRITVIGMTPYSAATQFDEAVRGVSASPPAYPSVIGGVGREAGRLEQGVASHIPGHHEAPEPTVGGVGREAGRIEQGVASHLPGHHETPNKVYPVTGGVIGGIVSGVGQEAARIERGVTAHLPGSNHSKPFLIVVSGKAGKDRFELKAFNTIEYSPDVGLRINSYENAEAAGGYRGHAITTEGLDRIRLVYRGPRPIISPITAQFLINDEAASRDTDLHANEIISFGLPYTQRPPSLMLRLEIT